MTSKKLSGQPGEPLVIERIFVDELFGRYTYDLEIGSEDIEHPQLMLLYGENGSGKTTILSLAYHLLSKELGKGHRTFLARTRFKHLAVRLSDGSELLAHREQSELIGSFRMEIRRGSILSLGF
jgi:predicted ATP-binding protein involved in virulence